MKLATLLQTDSYELFFPNLQSQLEKKWNEIEINQLCIDSRQVQKGDLFFAIPGHKVDGHLFLQTAYQKGAIAAVVEHKIAEVPLLQIVVPSSLQTLAKLASRFYGDPASHLLLCAITGTNGKTTTSFLVESLLQKAGYKTGLFGTILYRYPGYEKQASLTTPSSLEFHRLLADMKDHGVEAVALEASSHALSLERLTGVTFRIAAFTNLSQDHLDFHETMENYFQAKALLFRKHLLPTQQGGRAVLFVDDPYGLRLAQEIDSNQRITVSLVPFSPKNTQQEQKTKIDIDKNHISLLQADLSLSGTKATFLTPIGPITITSTLCGYFNLANLAVAVGIGVGLGLAQEIIVQGIAQVRLIPGRLERISENPFVFIDYAHTPDALYRVLETLKTLASPVSEKSSRLIVVFGCGGDRDRSKRPLMGQAASQKADVVILTSDNPRTENPQTILQEIVTGITLPLLSQQELKQTNGYMIEPDRRTAISLAIHLAKPGDIILLAGKGHENYQIIGEQKTHFDDQEEALLVIKNKKEK